MAFLEFLPDQKHAARDADIADTLDAFQDAGYVLTENDLIIDVDDIGKEATKKLAEMFDIKTHTVWTTRGAHFYFKKPQGFRRAQGICVLGFKVEFKHIKNTKAVTVKTNGVARETENEGVREVLPWFFEVNKSNKELLGMSENEGRNNSLFAVKRQIASKPGWETALRFINQHVFAEPLSDEELATVSRQEAVPIGEKNGEYFMAEYLIDELNFLGYGGAFYFKERGEEDYKSDEGRLIQIIYGLCPGVPTRYVDEVKKQMEYRCQKVPNDSIFKIRFNNGYLFDGEFIPITINEFTPYTIKVDYDADAEPVEVVDHYIDHLTKSDPEYRQLLMEVLGHTLIVDPEFKRLLAKFFIFHGRGGNGKGTLLQIIKGILGAQNVTGLGIKEMSDERYQVTMKGKLANLGDDIQDSSIDNKDMKILKNITTCDYISSRELYKQAESMYYTASLIFTSNHLIKSFEKGTSYKRRVMWMPMFTEVKEEEKDPLFITKLTSPESIKYWIRLIVEGYQRLYENHRFTDSAEVRKHNARYHSENNPYLSYLADIDVEALIGVPIVDGYKACEDWCRDNGIELNQKMFRDTLFDQHKIRTDGQSRINGRKCRVFEKEEE